MKKINLKKLLLLACCGVIVAGTSGCTEAASNLMTNAAQDIGAVADRNLDVIRDLERKGVISSSTATTYKTAIEQRKQAYVDLLSPYVSEEGTEEQKTKRKLKKTEDMKEAQKRLRSALVYSLGETSESHPNRKGVTTSLLTGPMCSEAEGCKEPHLDSRTNSELDDGWTAYSDEYLQGAHGDAGVNAEMALSFLDAADMQQLLDELNREIWVLDPNKIKTKEDMVRCLNAIQQVKNITDTGQKLKERKLVTDYFTKVDGLKLYNLEATVGAENSILALSTDNSDYIGRVGTPDMNRINKDVVVTAPVSITRHISKPFGDPPVEQHDSDDPVSIDVGVYTFRVLEFKENFVNGLNQEVFTTNQYIPVNPETSTSIAGGQSNEVGIALLMEYPVMALDGLTSPDVNSSDWKFEFLDYESTNMRINIYNGEMLVKDESGQWVEANKVDSEADRIYRVLPDNIGYIAEKQNTVSFIPSSESVTLSSGEVITQSNKYDKVKILKPKVDPNDSSVLEDKFEINLKDIFPEYFLKRSGYSMKDIGNDVYEISVYPDGDKAQLKAKKYESSSSVVTKELCSNLDSWDKVWELYDKYAEKIKTKSNKDFGDKTNFTIYKIYEKMKADNKFYGGNDSLRNNFSLAVIYNAFMDYFTSEGTNYLIEDVGNEYDRLWLEHLKNPVSFVFIDDDGSEVDYSLTYNSWNDATIDGVKSNVASLGSEYEEMFEKMCNYPGYECLGAAYFPKVLYKFEEVRDTILNDSNCGKEIDLTDDTRKNLKYDAASRRWEFLYADKTYIVTPMATSNSVTDARNITTVQFILTDYLELTYMPGVVDDEPFIATGRRICFEKFSGTGNEVIGYYANKYGDPIMNGSNERIDVKVSDIVDRSSGADYYEGIAKGLAFDAFKNEQRVKEELAKGSGDRANKLMDIFTNGAASDADANDTGMIEDKSLFLHTIYETNIKPVLQFTSVAGADYPSLDAEDVGSSKLKPSMYYGVCVNTNAFTTGLYTDWIDVTKDNDTGSLLWWNTWLGKMNYSYHIDIAKLKQVMGGVYAISLADIDDTITFNTNTIKVINQEMEKETEEGTRSLIRTIQVIIGIILLLYGFLMMACWLIDTNLVNGPGFLTILSFGRFVAIRDTSEMPRMVDNKIYTDFKYLCILTVMLTIMGIILVLFDIQDIWAVVNKLFSSGVSLFKDLMMNR